MDVERGLPCLGRDFKQTPVDRAARRVDENIHGSETRLRLADASSVFPGASAIGLDEFAAASEIENRLADRFGLLIQGASDQGKVGAEPGQGEGGGGPDSTGASGDEGDLSGERHGISVFLRAELRSVGGMTQE